VTKSPAGTASTVHTRSPGSKGQLLQQQQHPGTQQVHAVLQQAPFSGGTRDIKHRISNPSVAALGGAGSPRAETGHPGPPTGRSSSSGSSSHWGNGHHQQQLPAYGSPVPPPLQQQQQNGHQQQPHHHHHPHAAVAYAAAGGGLGFGLGAGPHYYYNKLGKPGGLLYRAAERLRQQQRALPPGARRAAGWGAGALLLLLLLCALLPLSPGGGGGDGGSSAPPSDVLLNLGPYFFNPSIVRHRGVYLSTARTAHMKRIDRTNWWFNEGYVCMSTTADFKTVSCRKFDPWQG
jgi:hypothetical protein